MEDNKIIVFSGAGISAESGISTFRDSNGLWENYAIEEVATPQAWNANPKLVQEFYNMRRKNCIEANPNVAHIEIANWEKEFDVAIITQNIDDLHERAGSSKVLHLHGNIRYAKSSGPNKEKEYFYIEQNELDVDRDFCPDGFPLRPHVVWFGEDVPMYETAINELKNASVLVVIGTSLNVYPAAGLINYVPENCLRILIDPKATELAIPNDFYLIQKPASEGIFDAKNLIQK